MQGPVPFLIHVRATMPSIQSAWMDNQGGDSVLHSMLQKSGQHWRHRPVSAIKPPSGQMREPFHRDVVRLVIITVVVEGLQVRTVFGQLTPEPESGLLVVKGVVF